MMPRQQSIGSNHSNSSRDTHNRGEAIMNVSLQSNMNYCPRGGVGREGNTSTSKSSGGTGSGGEISVSDHVRQRYPGGGDAPGGGPASSVGGQASVGMGDYGLQSQFGRATVVGLAQGGLSFSPGMNASMNPSALYPHLGQVASLSQHQSPQQQACLVDPQLAAGDFRGSNGSNPSSQAQAEREEELLLNLLIARRRRQEMRASEQQMGPAGNRGGSGTPPTSWADDWRRLRQQQQEQLIATGAEQNPYESMQSSLQAGDSSQRSRATTRMGVQAAGMSQLQHVNNIGISGSAMQVSAVTGQHPQFLPDASSRIQQRGNGVALPHVGSPQGPWMGGNSAALAGAMHHPSTPRNDNAYASVGSHHRAEMSMMSNTPLEIDVLSRMERPMNPQMMYDARMPDQGSAGGYPQFPSMGGHSTQGTPHLPDRVLGYGKRPALEAQGIKLVDKHGNLPQHHQIHQYFASAHKAIPSEEMQATKKRRLHKKKPADMPRRPLSAYNLFFSEERERILKEIEGESTEGDNTDGKVNPTEIDPKVSEEHIESKKPKALLRPLLPSEKKRRPHRKTHGKISFQKLATLVGQRWKALPDDRRKYYQDLAQEDMKRQKKAMEEYYQRRSAVTAAEGSNVSKD